MVRLCRQGNRVVCARMNVTSYWPATYASTKNLSHDIDCDTKHETVMLHLLAMLLCGTLKPRPHLCNHYCKKNAQ